MPLKITIQNLETKGTSTFELPGPQVRIGRNALNELTLEEGFVSQFHAVIRAGADGIHYQDLGSTNGSTLDGARLGKNVDVPVTAKSDLRIGMLRIAVEVTAASEPPARERQATGRHHTVAMFGMPKAGEGPPRAVTGQPPVSFGAASGSLPPSQVPTGVALAAPPQAVPPVVKELGRRLLPAGREPGTDTQATRLVEAVAVILDAFAHSFVGLRRGVEQTGAELGVRTVPSRSPLYTAKDHRQVLSYLLDSGGDPQARAQELVGVFADFGVHQVALLNGITEAVKALLIRLGPGSGSKGKMWPFGGGDQTADVIRELLEDDRQLHAAIFGEEFARAYAAGTVGPGGERR